MSGLFGNMGKFANTNPADIIYKMALVQYSTMHSLSDEEYREKHFQALKEENALLFDGNYQAFLNAHTDAKFSVRLQKTFDAVHIQWIKDIGLGSFLWDELGP